MHSAQAGNVQLVELHAQQGLGDMPDAFFIPPIPVELQDAPQSMRPFRRRQPQPPSPQRQSPLSLSGIWHRLDCRHCFGPRRIASMRAVARRLIARQWIPAWYSIPYPYTFTVLIMLSCIALFIWETSLASWHFEPFVVNPLWGPSRNTLIMAGGKDIESILHDGQGWRLLTSGFLHAGLIQLAINLIGLGCIGSCMEEQFGAHVIGPLFLLCNTFGTLSSCLFVPRTLSVGVSGGIYGLVGMAWADLLQNGKRMSCGTRCNALLFYTIGTLIGLGLGLMPFVDNFAQLGGLFMGFAIGLPSLIQGRVSCRPRQEEEEGPQVEGVPQLHSILAKPISLRKYMAAALGILLALFLLIGALVVLHTAINPARNWCQWCLDVDCIRSPYWTC